MTLAQNPTQTLIVMLIGMLCLGYISIKLGKMEIMGAITTPSRQYSTRFQA